MCDRVYPCMTYSVVCALQAVADVSLCTVYSNGTRYTLWDRWEVHGNKDMTLQQFIDVLKVCNSAYELCLQVGGAPFFTNFLPPNATPTMQCAW